MNKAALISAISAKTNLTKAESKKALEATIAAITEALSANEKVALLGFGTFTVQEKSARTGINPQTKEKIEIPARKDVKFKAGADLDAKVK